MTFEPSLQINFDDTTCIPYAVVNIGQNIMGGTYKTYDHVVLEKGRGEKKDLLRPLGPNCSDVISYSATYSVDYQIIKNPTSTGVSVQVHVVLAAAIAASGSTSPWKLKGTCIQKRWDIDTYKAFPSVDINKTFTCRIKRA
ncbi:hypothetical protein BGZ47_011511 [Haplosporangium gracile]|nr:hypothetical protein BGZ47_011511 [Haplosporangium gracile]